MFGVFVYIVALLFHGLQQTDSVPSKPCILPDPFMVDKWFTTQGRLMSFGRGNYTIIYKIQGRVQVRRSPAAYETQCLSDRKVQLRFKYSEGYFQCLTLTMIRRGLVLVEKIEDRAVVNDVIDCQDNRFSTTRDVEQFVLARYMPKGVTYGKPKCWTPSTSGSSKTAAELFIQSKMKFPDCMRTCVALSYRVFGFINGSSCVCAHDTKETFEIIAGLSEQSMKMCQVPCRGQHASAYPTTCGGTDHISTYSVETVENEGNFRYEDDVGGCWADVYVPGRHQQLTATFFMSPALCVRFCSSHGFLYAATSEGRVCTCRNSYGMLGKGRRCTAKCIGEQEVKVPGYCGNVNRPYLNNVYQVKRFGSDTVKRRIKSELRGTWYTSTVPQKIVQVYKRKILISEIQPEEGPGGMKTVIGTDEILDISTHVTRVRNVWVSKVQKYHVCLTFVMSDDNRTVDVTYVEASTDRFNNPCAMRSRNPDLRSYSQFAISRSPLPQKMEYTEAGCYFQDRADPVMYEAARHDNTGARLGECARFCYVKQLPYFAIMSRRFCYCGYGGAEEVLDSGCLAECGMTNFPCNNTSHRNMFTMKMYKIDKASFSKPAAVGCFNLIDFLPKECAILPLSRLDRCKLKHTSSKMMSPALCAHLCPIGAKYIHIYQGIKCHCGQTLEYSPTRPLETCDIPCPGDNSERCGGGETFVSVYRRIPRDRTLLSKLHTVPRLKRHRRAAGSGGHPRSSVRRRRPPARGVQPVKHVTPTEPGRTSKNAGPGKPVKAIKHIKPSTPAKQSKTIKSSKHARSSRAIKPKPAKHRKTRKTYPWMKPKQDDNAAKTPCHVVFDTLRQDFFYASPVGNRIVNFMRGYKFQTFIKGSRYTNRADPIYFRTYKNMYTKEAEEVTCYSDTTIRLVVRYNEMTSCMTLQIISKDVIQVENIRDIPRNIKSLLCSRQKPFLRLFNFVLSKRVVNEMKYNYEKCHPLSQTDTALLRSRKFYMTEMNVPACLRTCINLGYEYFGMLRGEICICFHDEEETFWTGGQVPPADMKLCHDHCKGQGVSGFTSNCGGKSHILSYRIMRRSRSKNDPHAADIQYLGCWADEYDVTRTPIWTGKQVLPLESCLDYCSNTGTLYATLSSRKICTCANHYGRLGPGEGCIRCPSRRIRGLSWLCGSGVIPNYHSVYIVTRFQPEAMKRTIPKDFRGFWYTHTSPRRQLIIYKNSIFMRTIPDVSKPDDVFYMTSRSIISPGKYVLLVQDFNKHSDDEGLDRSCLIMILSKDFISAEISYRKSRVIGKSRFSYPCHVSDKNLDKSSFDKYAVRRVPLPLKIGYKDHGCYFYNRNPLFSMAAQNGGQPVDKAGCARFCHAQDYQSFYIMNKTQCYCDDALSEKVLDAACTAKCGETADTCSGKKTALKIPVKEYRIDGAYMLIPFFRGCFLPGDSWEARCHVWWVRWKVPCLVKKESSDVMQPRRCARLCFPHRYFFIFNVTTCYCDVKGLNMPKIADSACGPCPGDVRTLCGGPDFMSGYDSHRRRFAAKPYARKSPPPLPLAKMNNRDAWKKPNDLFKDFFTSVDQISNWTENVRQETPAFVTESPEVLLAKPKTIHAVNESLYGNMHRIPCEQIPEQMQNHSWSSSMDRDRQVVFRKLHYETSSKTNSTRDPFHAVWKTTPTAFENRCYSDLKIRLKFKFSWRFSQCMTLTILGPDVVKVRLILHWYMAAKPLDCTDTNTNKNRRVYEFTLIRLILNDISFGWVKCFKHKVLAMHDRYIRLEGRRDDMGCLRTCVSLGYSSFGYINSSFYICTYDEEQAFGSCFGPNNKIKKEKGLCNEARFHNVVKYCNTRQFITVGHVSQAGSRDPFRHNDQVDGCWVDRFVPERHVMGGVPDPTSESCKLFCSKRGFLYAAGSSGKNCTCMNDYGLFGSGENCKADWPGRDRRYPNTCGNAEVPYLYSVYKILNFDDDCLKQVISPQFQGVWFASTLPARQIIIYEYQVFTRTLPAVTEPDDMELIEADEILQISENLLRIRQHWSQDGKDWHACMIIERAKHGNTAFVTYILANTNRTTNPCFMREKEKLLVNFSQFAMRRRPVPGDVGHKLKACYYMDVADPIMYAAVMYNNEAADQSECARFCYVTGLPYAAIMLKKHCYCGYGALEKVKDPRCQVRCGEKSISCHHKTLPTKRTMQLYRVGGVPLPSPPSVGCFQLTTLLRHQCGINALQQSTDCYMMTSYNDFMSPSMCAQLCPGDEGFLYILNGVDCYCASTEFHIVKAEEDKCAHMCADATDLRCGGSSYISVYNNTAPASPPAWNNVGPSIPPLPVTDMRKHMSSPSSLGTFKDYFEKLDEMIEWYKRNPVNLPLRQKATDDKITGSESDTVPGDSGEVLVQAGQSAILSCYNNDNPPSSGNLTFTWMKDDIPVIDSRFTKTPDGELTLRHAEIGDSAEYLCQVKGQDEDDNPINDKVNKTLIVFLLPDTRYLVRLKYQVTQCDAHLAGKKIDHARETLCTSTPCPFVHFQSQCHSNLHAAGMELWLSLTVEPSSDFMVPECEPECMEDAMVKHLQQELHLVKQFISSEKNNSESKLGAPTILANETVKQLVQGCPAGFIPATKVCTPCHPGTYAEEKSKECHPCKEGFYQPYYGTYKCYKCPDGSSKGLTGAVSEDSCLTGGIPVIGVVGGSSVAALVVVIAASVIVYRYTSLCRKHRSKTEEEGGGFGDQATDVEKLVSLEGVTSDCGDVPLLVPKVPRRLTAQPYAHSSNSAGSIDVESPGQHPALVTATSSRFRSRSYSHGAEPLGDTYSNRGSNHAHPAHYGSGQMFHQPHAAANPNYGPTPGMSPHQSYQSQLHEIRYAGASYNNQGVYTDAQLMVPPEPPPRHRSRSIMNENIGPTGQSPVYAPGHEHGYLPDTQTYPAGGVYNTGAHGPSPYDDYYHPANQTY